MRRSIGPTEAEPGFSLDMHATSATMVSKVSPGQALPMTCQRNKTVNEIRPWDSMEIFTVGTVIGFHEI